jgi:hypothetical protein
MLRPFQDLISISAPLVSNSARFRRPHYPAGVNEVHHDAYRCAIFVIHSIKSVIYLPYIFASEDFYSFISATFSIGTSLALEI